MFVFFFSLLKLKYWHLIYFLKKIEKGNEDKNNNLPSSKSTVKFYRYGDVPENLYFLRRGNDK